MLLTVLCLSIFTMSLFRTACRSLLRILQFSDNYYMCRMQWINRCDTVIYHLSNDFHQFLTISYHLTKTQSILLYPFVWRVSEEIKLYFFFHRFLPILIKADEYIGFDRNLQLISKHFHLSAFSFVFLLLLLYILQPSLLHCSHCNRHASGNPHCRRGNSELYCDIRGEKEFRLLINDHIRLLLG